MMGGAFSSGSKSLAAFAQVSASLGRFFKWQHDSSGASSAHMSMLFICVLAEICVFFVLFFFSFRFVHSLHSIVVRQALLSLNGGCFLSVLFNLALEKMKLSAVKAGVITVQY